MFGLNYFYIRNCVLVLTAQTLVLLLTANAFLVPRFELTPFTFGEIFMYCTSIMVLFHNLRLSHIHDHLLALINMLQNYSIADLQLKALALQEKKPEEIKQADQQ